VSPPSSRPPDQPEVDFEALGLGVAEALGLGVAEALGLGVAEALGLGVAEALGFGVGFGLGDGEVGGLGGGCTTGEGLAGNSAQIGTVGDGDGCGAAAARLAFGRTSAGMPAAPVAALPAPTAAVDPTWRLPTPR
jgi:hypothetical protein